MSNFDLTSEEIDRVVAAMLRVGCNATSCFHLAECFWEADLPAYSRMFRAFGERIRAGMEDGPRTIVRE